MGILKRELPSWVRVVRMSAHACRRCGAMVALDLLETHDDWHRSVEAHEDV